MENVNELQVAGPADSPSPPIPSTRKRGKYTSGACHACRSRKVKCGGGFPCQSCLQHGTVCASQSRDKSRKLNANLKAGRKSFLQQARSTNTLDRHGASILERLEELEQRFNHVDKAVDTATHSTRTKENLMTEPLRRLESANITLHNDNEDSVSMYEGRPYETEIFEAATDNKASTSLTSHIYALKYVLLPNVNHPTTSPSRPNTASRTDPERIDNTQYLRDLPSVQQLRRLTRSYFEHLGYFFPCIDEEEFELRFSQIEEEQFLDENDLTILVKPSDSAFIMLMCMVLAIATYLDPNSHKEKSCTSPGWHYLLMAESISRRRRSSIARDLDLDLVRYHTVKAMYMIHIEQLGGAYNAIAVAVQLAFRMGLNDQSLWNDCSDDEKSTRQLLWWTVYYMDRRVAQKCWRPYFIRESEVGVDDPELTNTPRYNSSDNVEETSSSDQNLSANQYIQTQIHWARLWALVWDTFFTVKAKNAGNSTEDVEIMDARILHVQRELDQGSHWHTSLLQDYIALGEADKKIRSRLVTFIRINLLRLLIRQNPLHTSASSPRGVEICVDLASDTIDAISAYMETRLNPVPFGLHAIECVVESMCHLAPHLNDKQTNEGLDPLSSFLRGIEFLERLSSTLGAARRALAVLSEIIDKGRQTVSNSEQRPCQNVPSCSAPVQTTSLEVPFNDSVSFDPSALNLQGLDWEPLSRISTVFPHLDWTLGPDANVDETFEDFSFGSNPFGVGI